MDTGSRPQYFPTQDSLAVEMLNKLQDASGFTTVTVPEGYMLQQPALSTPSLAPGPTPAVNAVSTPLGHASLRQTPLAGEAVILNSPSGLDPALTQLLVAAGSAGNGGEGGVTHSAASTLISDVPSALASNGVTSLQSPGLHAMNSVLSAAGLASSGSENTGAPVLLPSDAVATEPLPVTSSESITVTVHCTVSDTVIVVGQQNWQCCMCRDIHGFDISIDQHLALEHNLFLANSGTQENYLSSERLQASTAPAVAPTNVNNPNANANSFVDRKPDVPSSAHQPLETISQQALSSLQSSDYGSNRSGLEREVALLMAQTFTHTGDVNLGDAGTESAAFSLPSPIRKAEREAAPTANPVFASNTDASSGMLSLPFSKDDTVFDKMISKVERAILATSTSDTKNDLLLVATELARMRKDVSSKRNKMRKNHRYIRCPECGKEVRNRKDLIKQHNRCHEKTKKYRCGVCNKMFKYMHTLRRHIAQQGHTDGLQSDLDLATEAVNTSNKPASIAGETSHSVAPVKAESETVDKEIEDLSTVSFSPLSAVSEGKDAGPGSCAERREENQLAAGEPAYEKILAILLAKGEENRTATGRKVSLLQCFVCDREIRNRNYYITRHARCHLEDLCYTCSICRQEFYRSDYFKDHVAQHENFSTSQEGTKVDDTVKQKEGTKQIRPKRARRKTRKNWTPKPQTVPCKICGKGIFNRAYNIKRHAQQHSILEWEAILDSPRGTTHSTAPPRASLGSQRSIHCGMCGMSFKSYSLKRLHMLKHRASFSCKACSGKFGSGAEFVAHNHLCRKNGGAAVSSGGEQDSGELTEKGEDTERKQMSHVKKYNCGVCGASIIHSAQNISRHMRELHSDGQPHICPVCNRTYDSYHKLQRHLKSHGDTGGICHVCGKVFQTKSALRSHTKLHATPEGMFQCPQCPKSFRFQGRLEKHVRKHAEHADLCPHCGKIYISKIHLQRHISVVHMGIKDYRHKCNQCGAQFFESVQLRDHIAYRHKGIQLYTCKYCGKGFNCRPTMIRHERKEHTNYLPYKCKHCTQCFAEKSKLVAHEMTHTGVSPHMCDICSKYFTTGSALKAHKNLHLGVKPFVCSVCGKTYLKNWHLQQHVRKAHQPVEVIMYDLPVQGSAAHDTASSQPVRQQILLPTGQEVASQPIRQQTFNSAGQEVTSQPINQQSFNSAGHEIRQQSLLPAMEHSTLHPATQGEYLSVPTSEGGGALQQTGELKPVTHNLIQSHSQIALDHAIAYHQ